MTTVSDPRIPLDGKALRSMFARFPSGVVAVAGTDAGSPVAMVVSTFVPVSLEPPLVAICLKTLSRTWAALERMDRIGLSVLDADAADSARILAGREDDRFTRVPTTSTESGAMFVNSATTWMEVSTSLVVPAGDHVIALLDVHHVQPRGSNDPLIFHASAFYALTPTPS